MTREEYFKRCLKSDEENQERKKKKRKEDLRDYLLYTPEILISYGTFINVFDEQKWI